MTASSSSHLLLLLSWRRRRPVQGLQGGAGGRPGLLLQGDDEDLDRLLHQQLPLVGEQQVVVREAVADGVVRTHHVEQGGEERQGVSEGSKTGRGQNVYLTHGGLSVSQVFRAVKGSSEGTCHVPQCRLMHSRQRSQFYFCPLLYDCFSEHFTDWQNRGVKKNVVSPASRLSGYMPHLIYLYYLYHGFIMDITRKIWMKCWRLGPIHYYVAGSNPGYKITWIFSLGSAVLGPQSVDISPPLTLFGLKWWFICAALIWLKGSSFDRDIKNSAQVLWRSEKLVLHFTATSFTIVSFSFFRPFCIMCLCNHTVWPLCHTGVKTRCTCLMQSEKEHLPDAAQG